MNQDQVAGVIRVVVPFICALLAAQGVSLFGDASLVIQITTAVVGLASVGWSIYAHTNAAKLEAAAKVDPGIKVLVPTKVMGADDKIAALVADSTVPNVVKLTPGL